jgi:hypothetical protein
MNRQIKLTELNPRFASNGANKFLTFTCPECGQHEIGVQIAGQGDFVFTMSGTLRDCSLIPSVQSKLKPGDNSVWGYIGPCNFHFFIVNGYCIWDQK